VSPRTGRARLPNDPAFPRRTAVWINALLCSAETRAEPSPKMQPCPCLAQNSGAVRLVRNKKVNKPWGQFIQGASRGLDRGSA